jgi:transcriptional regulator with XRE-family HTH domain
MQRCGVAPVEGWKLVEKNDASPRLGSIVKALRQERGWSLADLGVRSRITPSTLSKVERGLLSLTYDRILQLANGLEVAVDQLFQVEAPVGPPRSSSRRSITRKGDGETIETRTYTYRYLNVDLLRKQQSPIITKLNCKTLSEFGELLSHDGEEFTLVLKGTVRFVCEHYANSTLQEGDSIYFDSSMPHAYLNAGGDEAEVLTVCTQLIPGISPSANS